jgi:DnaJ-domain-containing protein 1
MATALAHRTHTHALRRVSHRRRYAKALSRRADLYALVGDLEAELADVRLLLPTAGQKGGELRQRERVLQIKLKGTHSKRFRAILGIGAAAREEEIKKAYRALAKKFHPDKALQGGVAQAPEQTDYLFKMIHEAYEELLKSPHALDDEPSTTARARGEHGGEAYSGYGGDDDFEFPFFRRPGPGPAWPPRNRGGRSGSFGGGNFKHPRNGTRPPGH